MKKKIIEFHFMNCEEIITARSLANYIKLSDLQLIEPNECPYNNHIGALFTDIILQSGLNYRSVVAPRVNNVLKKYPGANSVELFWSIIESEGAEKVLNWKDKTKIERMTKLIEFCLIHSINYSKDIESYLLESSENKINFLKIPGIGNKTLDYLLKLLNIDTIAVDRHIFSFVEKAGIERNDYIFVKTIVEYAADILDVSRRSIDYSIWSHMSFRTEREQLTISF